jgi:glycerol-3-phosphate dehydrogenase (NAD+)
VGDNVLHNEKFEKEIKMYVYEEIINGRKLTEIINTDHENVKYLPGHKIPANVVSSALLQSNNISADCLF